VKLYYAPFACSLSPHIALREAGLTFELARVDLRAGTTSDGEDYAAINPKGYVPALRLDNGEVLSEGPAIVQYIADQKPEARLAPAPGSFARYRLQEWLNFISTEIHKQFSPMFSPSLPEPQRAHAIKKIKRRLAYIEAQLKEQAFLLGDGLSVADIYLFVVLRWTRTVRLDISEFPRLTAYLARIAERPAVADALAYESAAKADGP
jgi:glutathione S-transferase